MTSAESSTALTAPRHLPRVVNSEESIGKDWVGSEQALSTVTTSTGFTANVRLAKQVFLITSPIIDDPRVHFFIGNGSTVPYHLFYIDRDDVHGSTSKYVLNPNIDDSIDFLLRSADDEIFEDGMESELGRRIISIVEQHETEAVEAIVQRIVCGLVPPTIAAETLRCLARIDHPPTYPFRRWLLERSLRLSCPVVRDSAALGLSMLEDHHALPYLKKAIEIESHKELRADMQKIYDELVNE